MDIIYVTQLCMLFDYNIIIVLKIHLYALTSVTSCDKSLENIVALLLLSWLSKMYLR